MVKIAFHDNCLSERGTTVSLFDYAYYNQKILGNQSVIMYDGSDYRNIPAVLEKFRKEFTMCPYNTWTEVDAILEKEQVDILYLQKAGGWDGKIAHFKKNIIHCVFNTSAPHGTIYGRISGCFGDAKWPVVNYMVNLPATASKENFRQELNIPADAIVFGRHGGQTEFDIDFTYPVIDRLTDDNKQIYFVFVNTNVFCKRKQNIIHLDKIIDLAAKARFINTCDAMIHARKMGETFGAAIAEFSTQNKPIITCRTGDIEHLNILKDQCFIYADALSLAGIFNYFKNNIDEIRSKDWNAYRAYTPENIMKEFDEQFIKPCLLY